MNQHVKESYRRMQELDTLDFLKRKDGEASWKIGETEYYIHMYRQKIYWGLYDRVTSFDEVLDSLGHQDQQKILFNLNLFR